MTFSELLNILFGGGVIALIISVVTLRATVRKANAEAERAKADAERAKADAETVRITNTENATRILMENIVKPLKEELNATRNDLQATKREMASTKREMARLRKAVEAASGCRHADYCPVLLKLRDSPKDSDRTGSDVFDIGDDRHDRSPDTAHLDGGRAGEPGEPDGPGRHPP